MKSDFYIRNRSSQKGASGASHKASSVEHLPDFNDKAVEALNFISKKLKGRENQARYRRNVLGLGKQSFKSKTIKDQIKTGLENIKQKPFALYDLKTGKILMKRDLTAFEASRLNFKMEPLGMYFKNIPY